MKNLTTRKIVLGLLMVLVLAFSVQGIADALTFGTTRTGDLQTRVRGQDFSVTFTVDPVTEARKSAYTGYTATYTQNGVTYYYIDTNTDGDRDSNEPQVTASTAFYYNNEAVRISVSGAGAKITGITTANTITPAASITLKEGGSGAEALVASIQVHCSTSTHGEVTITASDVTPSEDYPSGVRKAPNFVLTTYVVQYNQAVGPTRTIRLVGVTNGVAIGYDDQRDQPIYNGDTSHYPVTYSISPGSGMLYIQEGTRTGTPATSLTTSTAAKVLLDMGGSTNTITATLSGSFETTQGIYIFGNPQLSITSGDNQSGAPNAALTNPLLVTLTDSVSPTPVGVAGVPIKFDVTDKSPSGGILSQASGTTIVDASNEVIENPRPASTMYVRSSSTSGNEGAASINFQLGTIPGEQTVTASALGIARLTKTIKATATPTPGTRQLFEDSIDRQGNTNVYTLVARVENGGQPDEGEIVTFTTTKGLLTGKNLNTARDDVTTDSFTAKTVYEKTNAAGKARVTYNIGDAAGTAEVVASISVIDASLVTQLQEVTFNVRGGSSGQQQQQQQQQQRQTTTQTPALAIAVSGTGATRSVTVTATNAQGANVPGLAVTLSGTALTASRTVVSGTPTTITLPTEPGSYTLQAVAGNYTVGTATITVAAPPQPGTLTINRVGDRIGNQQALRITAQTSGGSTPSSAILVTVSGVTLPPRQTIPAGEGSISFTATLPSTSEAHVVTVSATGYDDDSVIVPAPTSGQQQQQQQQQTTTAGTANSLEIDGQRLRSGVVNERLDAPLRVQVTDANDRGVSGDRVTFRVLSPARGTFAGARGRGNAVLVETDRNGYASATFTPTSAGDVVVRASVPDVSPVTFILDINGAPERATDTGTPDPGVTPSRETRREIDPVVHIGAANRPPMLWVDSGKIYALVGANVQEFGAGVAGAMNVAIGGGKVYWTEQTGESSGTINSANLDGTGAKELKSIMAVPMGIAVDTEGSKLYWTNSRGRIQSLNVDGSGRVENVLQNLSNPMDIAISRGNLYWTQYDATESAGAVGIANPTGRGSAKYISTGADMPGSLVVHNNKVYWTEMTGTNSGTINSANLAGTGATQLTSILAAPSGIAVDGSRSKLYWTNSRGRIQSADLNGKKIQNIVDGLGMPGDMVISNSIKAPAAAPTPSPTASKSKYDINGDGTVDSTDAGLVVLAISTGDTNDRLDVNGDGKVNFSDYVLVTENFTEDAAAAPTLLGIKMTTIQIDRLQEQIDLLIASGDRSPATMRALIYFQQLIAMARPEKTQLLANYPNPFNPETWIPYELATDTNVKITIYNTHGVVIRTLELGHQSAGYYTGRERAAYWDGRNAFGEQVASGVYYYQFETDDLSSMRKMVILK